MKKIFIASPFFSLGERDYIQRIDKICTDNGFKTFQALRNVGLVSENSLEDCFQSDVENLKQCDFVVANLDGIDVDSGTAWELGYAYCIGKPIIGIREDFRMYRTFIPVNLMIYKSCNTIITLDKLSVELQKY